VGTDPRIITDDKVKPWIAVSDYTDTGVKLNVGVWTNRADYANVQADLLRQIKPGIKPLEPETAPALDAPGHA
jgi:small-conductance mechanosensitive channel